MAQAAADLVICLFVAEIRFVMGSGRVWCVYKSRAYYPTANGLPSSVAAARFSVFATNRVVLCAVMVIRSRSFHHTSDLGNNGGF